MGRHSYNYSPCEICGREMSNAGFAVAAHMQKHVREGLVRVVREPYTLRFDNGTRRTELRTRYIKVTPAPAAKAPAAKLSAVMRDALGRAQAAGGLFRWPGAFWTDQPYTWAVHDQHRAGRPDSQDGEPVTAVPAWYTSPHTVQALVDRGLLARVDWTVPPVAGRKLAVARLPEAGQ